MTDRLPAHAEYLARRPPRFSGFVRRSFYLPLRDGTRLAIDVSLPKGANSQRLPTILRSTRYYRRFRLAPPLRALRDAAIDPLNGPLRALFTSRGYAFVDVDARGSGASFGFRPCPWWLDGEVKDGAEIVDWIVRQPWSNGSVGATGVSYEGTSAELLLWNRHPAVRAVAPRFSLFDVYPDIAFPGGVHLAWFTESWGRANAALDRNQPEDFVGNILALRARGGASPRAVVPGTLDDRLATLVEAAPTRAAMRALLRVALAGVAPIDDDDGSILRAAVASHARNWNVHEGAVRSTFRDDVPDNAPLEGHTVDRFSPSSYVAEIAASGAAVLSYGGWFDGAYANSAIKRHRALGGEDDRLLLGPWVHGGLLNLDPHGGDRVARFDHGAELLRFFDRHLAPEGAPREDVARVRYYAMGRGSFREASTFPPSGVTTRVLHLALPRKLRERAGASEEARFAVDPRAGTGRRTRWETLLSFYVHADWPDRAMRDGQCIFESEPLEDDLEVVGHPVLLLSLSSSERDGAVFAYLEDVARDGSVRMVTEGSLRLLHRTRPTERGGSPAAEASFLRADAIDPRETQTHAIELLPTCYLYRRWHRVRLALAGADVDHFATPPGSERAVWTLRFGEAGSKLLLPVLP